MWASILATLLSMGHHLAPHIIQCQVLQPLLTCWQVGSLRTGSGHRARLGLLVTTNTWQEMACTAWAQVLVYRVCFLTREPPQHRSWSLVQCNSERRGVPHPQCALCSLPDTWRMLGCKAWPSPVWHVSCTMLMARQICQRLHHSVCHFTWPYRQERNQAEPRQCTMWSRTGRAIDAVVKYPEVCSEWIVTLLCPVTTSLSSTASPSHTWAHLLRACYAQEHEPHSQLHIHVPGKDMARIFWAMAEVTHGKTWYFAVVSDITINRGRAWTHIQFSPFKQDLDCTHGSLWPLGCLDRLGVGQQDNLQAVHAPSHAKDVNIVRLLREFCTPGLETGAEFYLRGLAALGARQGD